LRKIINLSDNLDVGVEIQHVPNRLPENFSVVGDEYGDWNKISSKKSYLSHIYGA
jgi:hypothetical protein